MSILKKLFQQQDKFYVSEEDAFLKEYDKKNPGKSIAQEQEVAKHVRIARMRDRER